MNATGLLWTSRWIISSLLISLAMHDLCLSIWHRWISSRQTVVKFKTQSHSPIMTSHLEDWKLFLGFTGDFICKLVLKSLRDWQLFRQRLNGIGCFQRWCLHCAKVRQDISFTFLFTDPWTLKQKVEDPKDTAALSCWHKMKLLVTDCYRLLHT